jgi:glucosylceramidase
VDSQAHQFKYTPEYYAYLHYSHFITPGSSILGGVEKKDSETPVLVARNPLGKYIVVAANLSDTQKEITVQLDKKFINATLPSHSFHTFQVR